MVIVIFGSNVLREKKKIEKGDLETDMTSKQSPCYREGLREKEHPGGIKLNPFFDRQSFLHKRQRKGAYVQYASRVPFIGNRKLSLQ